MTEEKAIHEFEVTEIDDKKNAVYEDLQDKKIEFDDLLSSAGEFGKYQLLLLLTTCPFYFFGAFTYFTQLFLTEASPNHWCWIPELENLTDIDRRNLAIPADDSRFGYSHCKAYVGNWTDVLLTGRRPDETWNVTTCQHGWEFNKTEIPYPTITSEMGWVCNKDSYQATAQVIFFSGSIVGGFLIGWISDRFGRIPAIIICCLVVCIGGVGTVFVRDFLEFSVCRFFMGLGHDNIMVMMYLLLLEYVAPKYRSIMENVSFGIFFSFAVTVMPWIALGCGHWKTLSLVTSLPMLIAVFVPFVIPESPRWILSKGRLDNAVEKILMISRINKKEVPAKLIEKFKETELKTNPEDSTSVLELFRRPLLRKMFTCSCLQYICCSLVFDGLVRNIGTLDFDFFITFSVMALTEFPSVLSLAILMDLVGRKWLATCAFATTCLFCILTVFVTGGLSVTFVVIARFFINMAYATAMQWSAEMLPTPVRGSGVAIVHICGLIGTIFSSCIVLLEKKLYWLPLLIVGFVAALGSILAQNLPETAKREMPQTFDDAERLIKEQKHFDVLCLNRKAKSQDIGSAIGNVNESFEML